MAFDFQRQGSHAAIRFDGQEILKLDEHVLFFGDVFQVTDQHMAPGGGPEVASLPVFNAYGYTNPVSDVDYQADGGGEQLSLTIMPTRTRKGAAVFDQVWETCRFDVRLVDGRFEWTQTLTIDHRQDLDTRDLHARADIRLYRFVMPDGSPGAFIQFADPLPVGGSGPAVPMTRDWQGIHEPFCGPDSFRQSWRRRYVSIIFQDPDGSFHASELNKTKWFFLTQDNRRARLCHPEGLLYLVKDDGQALEYRCQAPSHYHHVCEWGMDFHFWCDMAPFTQDGVIPAGTTIACSTTSRLVDASVVGPVAAAAVPIELTERERQAADRPAYEEPENTFTVSALERMDALAWRPTSEGCAWQRDGGHEPGGGSLVIHNDTSDEGQWRLESLGPSQWANPFVAGARYRLSAWVRVESFEPDPSMTPGPQVGVVFEQHNGPSMLSERQRVDCGWSQALVGEGDLVPEIDWTRIELVTPPCPSYVPLVDLTLRLKGRGKATFSSVCWEMIEPE
jgi:hypothetical protein